VLLGFLENLPAVLGYAANKGLLRRPETVMGVNSQKGTSPSYGSCVFAVRNQGLQKTPPQNSGKNKKRGEKRKSYFGEYRPPVGDRRREMRLKLEEGRCGRTDGFLATRK